MGNGHSVSSVIDELHALKPEERSTALDNLFAKHEDIRTYLKSKYHEHPAPHRQPNPKKPHLKAISIEETLPAKPQLTPEKFKLWRNDPNEFWAASDFILVPPKTCCNPLHYVYSRTIHQESANHDDCLRTRYLALFWLDYFKERYPNQEKGYDGEYANLGRELLHPEDGDNDSIVSRLRRQVRAGKRYNMLTTEFGDGILLAIPSSVGRSTLEKKLPLDKTLFKNWVHTIVESGWVQQANGLRELGTDIRRTLLNVCINAHRNESSLSRPSKRQKVETEPIKVLSNVPWSKLCNTDEANQYHGGVSFHQGLYLPPSVADHSRGTLTVTHIAESSTTTTNMSARSAQVGEPTSVSSRAEMDNTAGGGQQKEGAFQNAHCATPGWKLRTGPSHQKTGDPMLSDLSARDWGTCDIDVFRPVPFEPETDPELFQPQHFHEDGDEDMFLPESFGSGLNDQGTSNSPL